MPEVITFGETMVSMIPTEMGHLRYVPNFRRKMGGAESNVAIALTRLAHPAGFVTAFGEDALGHYAYSELLSEGLDLSRVVFDPQHRTGVMFKELLGKYETKVWYYRENSAASHMTASLLDTEYLEGAKILHVTGITMAISQTARQAVLDAVTKAKALGLLISFDPNIRLRLWSREEAAKAILPLLPQVDIIFPGLEESEILFGPGRAEEYIRKYLSLGIEKVALKVGKKGCYVADCQGTHFLEAYPFFDVVDTVGAGDAFDSGFLAGLLEGQSLTECGTMANCMGAMATKSSDDYQMLPTRRELDVLLQKAPPLPDR